MERQYPLSITARGQKWSATWYTVAGELHVSSAYGSAKELLGRRKPAKLAETLLSRIVEQQTQQRPARPV